MSGFRILLKVHGPIIMPRVAPRLALLLAEALARVHRDWRSAFELPLKRDPVTGYRGSQLILNTRPAQPLAASLVSFPDATPELQLEYVSDPPGPFKEGSAAHPKRLTQYQAINTPFASFYGEGDGEKAARLLELLDGLGREHMHGYGRFDVEGVWPDDEHCWRKTPHRAVGIDPADLPFQAVADHLRVLSDGEAPEAVWRPPRLLREILPW